MPAANFSSTTQSPSHCTSYLVICALAVGKNLPFPLLNRCPQSSSTCFFRKFIEVLFFADTVNRQGSEHVRVRVSAYSSATSPPPSLKGCSCCFRILELGILMNLQPANSLAYSRSCYVEASWNQDRVGFVLPPLMAYVQPAKRQSFHSLALPTVPAQGKPRDPLKRKASWCSFFPLKLICHRPSGMPHRARISCSANP